MRILFMGTPEFAVESLGALYGAGHDICGVFTRPDAPKGRGMRLCASPVKEFAAEKGVPVYQPVKLRDGKALEIVAKLAPELIVVVAYGRILPSDLLSWPPLGCVNVHASLLPKLRGAAPINWAVAGGERDTGITTMYMAEELDAGDILMQKKTPIGDRETAGELHDRLMQMGAVLLLKTVDLMARSAAKPRAQDHSKATYAPILSKADAQIDCERPALQVDCFIRGMNPWPGARLGDFIVHRAEPVGQTFDAAPGEIMQGGFLVCGGGSALRLIEVQAPGAKRMSYHDYERGRRV